MSYNSNLPADTTAPAEIRENFRALKEDKIVAAATAITAESADKLANARMISLVGDATGSVNFDGSSDVSIAVDVLSADTSAQCTGNAATATKLETARNINGVAFDGTKNIIIPVVAPRCKAHTIVETTIPSGVQTYIAMAGVDYDTDNIHTSDPTKFQINTPGLYLIVHQENLLTLSNTMDSSMQWSINVSIIKNGCESIAVSQPANDGNVSALVYLNAGDYIQPTVTQSSGVAMKTNAGTNTGGISWGPYISIVKISD